MKKFYVSLVVVALLVIIGLWVRGQSKIDSCLDLGGRWNYEKKECERGEEDPEHVKKN